MGMLLVSHTLNPGLLFPSAGQFPEMSSLNLVNRAIGSSLVICVVNCFVLISGFYGIKLKLHKFFSLYAQIFFFAAIATAIQYVVYDGNIGIKTWFHLIFSLSSPANWFIPCYVVLMLVSPFLNRLVEQISHREFIVLLIIFTVINLYMGWLIGGTVNNNGYNYMQFIYLYFIGRYLKLHVIDRMRKYRYVFLGSYLIFCSIYCISIIVAARYSLPLIGDFKYNNPAVLLSSISFFLFFASFDFQNKVVNWIGKSAFAVYLLHCSNGIFDQVIQPVIRAKDAELSSIDFVLWIIPWIVGVYVMAILLDKIRIWLMTPLEQSVQRISWMNKPLLEK